MFSTPEFWVFIAFLLFLGGIWKRAFSFLTQSLDEHRQKIAYQLAEAERLHDEALSLLNSYKIKHQEAINQAAQIVAFAEKEADAFKKSSEESFKIFLIQKEKALLDRIAIATKETKSKLRQETVDEALAIVEQLLLEDPKLVKRLTDASLQKIFLSREK